MKKFRLLLLILMGTARHVDADLSPGIGDTASIHFLHCLNKPITPTFLEGKFVILDFWATWCAPCIAGFPHFDSLSLRYSRSHVVFALCSKQSEQVQRAFFKKHKPLALYLQDVPDTVGAGGGIIQNRLGVVSIPYCVVLDPQGVIRWRGPSGKLSNDILDKILKGEHIAVVERQESPSIREYARDTIRGKGFRFTASWAGQFNQGMGYPRTPGEYGVFFRGRSPEFMCSYLRDISPSRINNLLDKDSFIAMTFFIDTSLGKSYNNRLLIDSLLQQALHIRFVRRQVLKEVWTVQVKDRRKFLNATIPVDSTTNHSSAGANEKSLFFINRTLPQIFREVEAETKMLFEVPHQPLDGRTLEMTIFKDFKYARTQLLHTYGLDVSCTNKLVEIVEIVNN